MKEIIIRYTCALITVLSISLFTIILLPLTLYASYVLSLPFLSVSLSENTLIFDSGMFTFIPACAATLAYVLLLFLIFLTSEISFAKGIKMFFLGSAIIFIMNLIRILFLIYLYINFGGNYFESIHLILWHFVSTIFVAGVWIFLVEFYEIKSIPIVSDIKIIIRRYSLGKQ